MIQVRACALAIIFTTGTLTVVCNTMGMLIITDTAGLKSVNVVLAEGPCIRLQYQRWCLYL